MQSDVFFEKYKKQLIFIGVLLIAAAIAIFVVSSLRFKVTGTDPKLSAVSTISPTLTINFNKQLSVKGLSVSSGNKLIRNYQISGKKLIITADTPLVIGQKYTLTIKSIQSESGSIIRDKTLTFVVKDIPYDGLSTTAQKKIISQQDQNQGLRDDPIMRNLPHSTLDFNLTGLITTTDGDNGGKGVLVLKAQLLLTASDVSNGRDAAIAQYKQEVIDYIKSIGFDPAKYTIEYQIIESSPQAG